MKQIHVGTFKLASLNVDLYAMPNSGSGEFSYAPDAKSLPRIKVGIEDSWQEAVEILLHESLELCLSLNNHRSFPENRGDAASHIFHFNHIELTRVCQHQGQFIAAAMPELAKVYNRQHKRK